MTAEDTAEPRNKPEYRAPRYIQRFECIGPACEQSCCGGWRIHVDRPHYERMRAIMSGVRADRRRFVAALGATQEDSDDDEHFATLRMKEDGSCSFLDDDGLCFVWRRHGEGLLGNMCATYPRESSRVGDRVEITATLSCPEVARLCLLVEDAMELDSLDPSRGPRAHVPRSIDPDPGDPYIGCFESVRDAILRLLSASTYRLASRLFFVTYLADKIGIFLHRGARPFDPGLLRQQIDNIERPQVLEDLDRRFRGIEIPGSLGMQIIQAIVQARMRVRIPGFERLVLGALSSYAPRHPLAGAARDAPSITPEELWASYKKHRDNCTAAFGTRMDSLLGNYCKNYWLREWYVFSPTVLMHAQKLLVRLAIVRFLVFGHPGLGPPAAATREPPRIEQQDLFDAIVVEVFYKVARAFEHDTSFLDRIQAHLEALGMQDLAHTMFLLDF